MKRTGTLSNREVQVLPQDLPGDAIIEAFQKEWDAKAITFPFREQWDDAAEDIIRQVFPRTALPLTSASKDA